MGYSLASELAGVQVLVERAIKKNWLEESPRFFATTFQMGQTRRVLSGVKNPELEITATRRQSEKTSFFTY